MNITDNPVTSVLLRFLVTVVLMAGITTLLAHMLTLCTAERWRPVQGIPGPRGWPIVGSLFSLGKFPHLKLMEMARIYGNVYQLRLGNQYVVVVNGIRAIKESLLKKSVHFAGRPAFPSMTFTKKYVGVVFDSYNENWKSQRVIIDSSLKKFTSGPTALEDVVTSAAMNVVNSLTNHGIAKFDAYDDIYVAVGNVTCFVLFGKRYSHNDNNFKKVLYLSKQFDTAITGKGNIIDYLPWMTFAMRNVFAKLGNDFDEFNRFIDEQMNSHVSSNYKARSVVDSMIRIRNDAGKTKGCPLKTKTDIKRMLCCLFGAGYENTTNTIYYLVLYMIIHPEIQCKVHEEIDRVVTRDRLPTLSDRAKLPYTDAVVQEVIRHASLFPLSIPYSTLNDTDILGYTIPKETPIFVNLWSVNYDESEWKDPHRFNPDRFLSDDGLSVKKSQVAKIVAFGLGKSDAQVLYLSKQFDTAITGKGNIIDYLPWMTFAMRKVFAKLGNDFDEFNRFIDEQMNSHCKVHEEIDRVVTRDRLPTLSDRAKLPYTDAVVQEVIRHASLFPLSIPYSTLNDTDILGYTIPKETPIFVNLWSVNYDESEWKDPHRFNPDRFLSDDGLSVKKSQVAKIVAFGLGKKRCPGQQLAQLELFLFFAIFMHQCQFEKCEGDNPQLTSVYGLTLRPVPFRVVTKQRGPVLGIE
uniref:Cytochrome P450 1A5-like n=1 Tax=Saccoglossus kowalevskii TaxID=10224 RepID=A0ABM0MW57_SACKO|nr:PREDICTED: cytochrome P450 1A5-like [Saccoglossus kowalevskii]